MCLVRSFVINTRLNFGKKIYFFPKVAPLNFATKCDPLYFANRNRIFGNVQRELSLFNRGTQISRPPQDYPLNSKYERFKSAVPFYQKRIFWVYFGGVGAFTGIYYMTHLETVPITNRRRFLDVTPKQEEYMAQQAYRQIMNQYQGHILPSWDNRTIFVRKVAEKLIKVSGMQGDQILDLKWEFHVIDSPERNAFVLPGGKIFVFTGILPIVENKDGLAAVLGHEIGHQIARHSAEKFSFLKILLMGQILLSIFIDSGFLSRLFIDLGILLPFSRKCEMEADYIGLLLMAQACFNPEEAIGVWERMNRYPKTVPQFLSTHPNPEHRIKNIRQWMPEALQKVNESDCVNEYEGFRKITDQFRPQWVVW
ncbi:10717_t:CDS:2 [Acaulospora morrowiae]|uniref:10717_t:CDS:1 n=1 Tax=Acaulospora morrowiae TaxID=94023 RepID=A0A9N9FJY3_9GLOM|nr:10717_t:CDS:2 [Acaulospora morrowiae]